MKNLFRATIKNGELDFGSDYNFDRYRKYLRDNDGKKITINNYSNPVSDEMRGYMFGALIPFLRQIDAQTWGGLDSEQIHEVLKKNFNYFEAYNPLTKRLERYGQSVMNVSMKNLKAIEFIERIANWVMENYGQTLPDPEDYKRFRDSAPTK